MNYKRVERLYQDAKLQVSRRKRKKILLGERQSLLWPEAANQVWSMDFVFDRTGEGRVTKALTIVYDATQEAAAIIESFNGRLRDECLNEHWFPTLLHARTEIETWRREYNEERPRKILGGLTPAAYAQ